MYSGEWWRFIYADDAEKAPGVTWQLIRRVLNYAKPYWFKLTLMLVTIIISAGLSMVVPLALRELIDHAIPEKDASKLNLLALALFFIPIFNSAVLTFQRWLNSDVGEGLIFDLRRELYNHMQRMSVRFYVANKTGELMSRLNNDVVGAQQAINNTFVALITNSVTVIGVLIVMFSLEWRLTLAGLVILPLVIIPARRFGRNLRTVVHEAMTLNAKMNAVMNETLNINGIMLTKLFGRASDESARFEDRARKVAAIGVQRAVMGSAFFAILGLVGAFGTAVVYWLGGHLVLSGALTVGTLVAFAALLGNLYGPLQALVNAPVELASSLVSFERVFEVVDLPVEVKEKENPVALKSIQGKIEFEDVTFSYNALKAPSLSKANRFGEENIEAVLSDAPVDDKSSPLSQARTDAVQNLNFTIEPGQLAALVGPSGAGKTTITYLLPRLYDPTSGVIRIDGYDLRDVGLKDLADNIGMVTQESYLFHDTIRTNLLYAKPDASLSELEAACKAANIYDFISELPNGFDTIVGERGYRLSGGEKQRIAIARVILKNPQILVLDEATSHLDSQSEVLIQNALEKLMQDRTSLVIAHRLSTILAADVILVMDRGQLIERGTHEELLAQGGLYAELYETQFKLRSETAEVSEAAMD
jgi:ATP-binding cassette subfamily B protein